MTNRSASFGVAMSVVASTVVAAFAASPSWAQEAGTSSSNKPRIEKDLLGEKEIPDNAYHGVQTARALEIIREKKLLTEQQIQELLDPVKLTGLDKAKYTNK